MKPSLGSRGGLATPDLARSDLDNLTGPGRLSLRGRSVVYYFGWLEAPGH